MPFLVTAYLFHLHFSLLLVGCFGPASTQRKLLFQSTAQWATLLGFL
jgi:hypothetical protein